MTFRRRDVLLAVLGLGGLAAVVKIGGRAVVGPAEPAHPLPASRLKHLSPRLDAVAAAAAAAMLGDLGAAAIDAGRWDPAADLDGLLDSLAPDQRTLATISLHLLEEWSLGLGSFSRMTLTARRQRLDAWRSSNLTVQRAVWGLLHAAFASSFARSPDGWALMRYPGPCVPGPGSPGRPPGQTVAFAWDERVP